MSKLSKNSTKRKSASSFWMDDTIYEYESAGKQKDLMKMAGYQRAIANFVKILTNRDIPVRYAAGHDSFTDGSRVTISAKMDDANFDPTVGLALHEGSHILLTDFNVLKDLDIHIRNRFSSQYRDLLDVYNSYFVISTKIKEILNIIEDRRIDFYVYKNAPGYQLYYKALYTKYFNNKLVDKALRSKSYRTEDWESYMFRLINITNPNKDLNALKFLPSIYKLIDLPNIDRLKNTQEALELAMDVFLIIHTATNNQNATSVKLDKNKQSSLGSSGTGNNKNTPNPTPKSNLEQAINELINELDEEVEEELDEQVEDEVSNDNESEEQVYNLVDSEEVEDEVDEDEDAIVATPTQEGQEELSASEELKVKNAIKTQQEFVGGDVKKSKLSRKEASMINAIEESDSAVKEAQVEVVWNGNVNVTKVPVVLVRNVTPFVVNSGAYNQVFYSDNNSWQRDRIQSNLDYVNQGLSLGAKLGKKMKIRNEERDTKFTRLKSGAIDKRLIASLGYGAESVFHKMEQFKYKPMYFHLSLDASGSMSGERFNSCIRLASAIAKAADMVGNIRVVIDIRTAIKEACVAVLYDSNRDPLSKLVYNLSHSNPNGSTPEGLCFDVIMNDILKNSQNTDAIFFNLSDGEPSFTTGGSHISFSYHGQVAFDHTRKQVQKMIKHNISVISYFISDYINGRTYENFVKMYGKSACQIDTQNIIQISKTINERMMQVC